MQVIVDKHTVTINKNEIVNEGEYNIQSCEFQFSEEFIGLSNIAVFTGLNGSYKVALSGNTCIIPIEVLQNEEVITLGVYAYDVDGEELILRYSPTPDVFTVEPGSYVANAQNSSAPTPTEVEQLQSQITQNANDIDSLEEITGTHTTQIETIQGDISDIKSEQTTQNTNIGKNADDISDIKTEQTTQNQNISQNTTDIETINRNLANYSLVTETGSQIALNINSSNYQMTAILKDKNGNIIYTSNVIDLPIESMIINATYDSTTKEIVFTLQNGNVLRVSVADLVSGLVSTDELQTILASYYTKSEIDNLLSTKANSSDVYTKSQTDNLLNAKANSSDVYSKSETDNLLSNKVDTTTFTESQAEQDTNINALNSLVNQMPTVSGQGTDLSLQDVLNYRLMKFLPQGSSSQFSTTGANILNNMNYSLGGISFSDGSDISGSDTYRFNEYVPINENTTFYLLKRLVTFYYDEDKNLLSNSTSQDLSKTTPANTKYVRFRTFVGDFSTFNNTDYMVSLNSITSYEPYTDGPAPNASYPFPVKVVTGENGTKIQNKNFFDYTNYGYIYKPSGLDVTKNISEFIINGTNTGTEFRLVAGYNNVNPTYKLPYGNYKMYVYLNGEPITVTANLGDGTRYQAANVTNFTINQQYSGIATIKITIPASTYINAKLQIVILHYENSDITFEQSKSQNYQLSLGNLELSSSSDGTIRDYIYGTPNTWYKKAYFGKTTDISGSTGITISGMKSNGAFYSYYGGTLNGTTITYNSAIPGENTIYYELATPTDIDITDATLIGQLNTIYNNAYSYNGTTNITTTYASGNEQMYLDIEVLKDVWSEV